MTRINLPETPTVAQRLQPRGGLAEGVHLLDHASIHAINAALIGNRPLLLRGSPGVGKSQLARAAADLLGRSLVNYTVTSRTETDDLLWQVDLVSRLAEAQLAGATGNADRVRLEHFVCPGPLWWGFDWGSAQTRWRSYRTHVAGEASAADPPDTPSGNGVVVLIDEIDKADSAIPNGLLDALGHGGFSPPGVPRVCLEPERPPLVIFTTNEERHLPDAFLRRCFVHTMRLSRERLTLIGELRDRGRAHNEVGGWGLKPQVIVKAAEIIADDRLSKDARAAYRPGVAEFIDLLRAVRGADDPGALLETLKTFVLAKQAAPE